MRNPLLPPCLDPHFAGRRVTFWTWECRAFAVAALVLGWLVGMRP